MPPLPQQDILVAADATWEQLKAAVAPLIGGPSVHVYTLPSNGIGTLRSAPTAEQLRAGPPDYFLYQLIRDKQDDQRLHTEEELWAEEQILARSGAKQITIQTDGRPTVVRWVRIGSSLAALYSRLNLDPRGHLARINNKKNGIDEGVAVQSD